MRPKNDLYNTNVEAAVYREYIRYQFMETMVALEFPSSTAEHINVFIDLYDILNRLRTVSDSPDAVEMISSGILNMVAHYKNYFWDRHRVTCDIIFVYGDPNCQGILSELSDYNRANNNKGQNEVIQLAIDRILILIPYIPDTYIKLGYAESAIIIKNILLHEKFKPYPSIIISSSQYMYTLPGMADRDMNEVVVFRNKYTHNGVTAYSYNEINAVNAFIAETRNLVCQVPIDPDIITLIMTLCGVPGRNVRSVKNIELALIMASSMPREMIDDIPAMYRFLCSYCREKKQKFITEDEFGRRYRALSVDVQLQRYQLDPNALDFSFLTKLDNADAMRYINTQYFSKYPLNFARV